jgi:hypothetical protein
VVHLIRDPLRYASKRYWAQLTKDLKLIYTAADEAAAAAVLDAFTGTCGERSGLAMCGGAGPGRRALARSAASVHHGVRFEAVALAELVHQGVPSRVHRGQQSGMAGNEMGIAGARDRTVRLTRAHLCFTCGNTEVAWWRGYG